MREEDTGFEGGCDNDDDQVMEWELGLPDADDLTPLSQSLTPPELVSAFRITPEPHRTMADVNQASESTISSLQGQWQAELSSSINFDFKSFNEDQARESVIVEADETDLTRECSDSRKLRRIESASGAEEADSAFRTENGNEESSSARTLKRPRLVWTPQLHKRFVDVVAHLGIKSAVPKTIMQMMNVEGLTRENVASHLQKYRLYLKRMQGLLNEAPSPSDHLFASTAQEGNSSGPVPVPVPVPMSYGPSVVPMNMMSPRHGMVFEPHPYKMMQMQQQQQQRDWSGNSFGFHHDQ